ncbi:hypothetical protein DSCA_34060 [Desulfosarcina alkanivorans]|uniref:DUF3224 domain-containing protein n=1 Tax=Desulfosarcina alkanivorans TaxID=571177 RepID=A0A5K7YJU8_9BACT|nr:hypothetical protein [Desulfosarcina alkanivorans]BBO69476.1 hypothetical protein DSCA_34060 [Desulfosarcina alkanivorans]
MSAEKNPVYIWPGVILLFLLVMLAAGRALAEEAGTFSGSWIVSGTYRTLDFAEGREVLTFRLSGHVNLKNEIGTVADLWSECTGLWDAGTGTATRCVWRTPGGEDAAYSILEGRLVEEGVRVNGTFVGGAGRLKGLTGGLTFTWTSVFRNRTENRFTGHTENLSGSYQLP